MKNKAKGFTLVEILIALFIFTLISAMLMTSFKSIINAQSGSETKATQLRNLQMAFLLMSRDIEQAVNRPILDAEGKKSPAFQGGSNGFVLTHGGFANPAGTSIHSTLQRTGYGLTEGGLARITWPVLDQAPQTKSHKRILLKVINVKFEYLDEKGRFNSEWPTKTNNDKPFPQGVRINIVLAHGGNVMQLYLIPIHMSQNSGVHGKLPPSDEKKQEEKKQEDKARRDK